MHVYHRKRKHAYLVPVVHMFTCVCLFKVVCDIMKVHHKLRDLDAVSDVDVADVPQRLLQPFISILLEA